MDFRTRKENPINNKSLQFLGDKRILIYINTRLVCIISQLMPTNQSQKSGTSNHKGIAYMLTLGDVVFLESLLECLVELENFGQSRDLLICIPPLSGLLFALFVDY